VSIALLLPATALLAFAATADRTWFVRHVLVPAYYLPPPAWTLLGLRVACVVLALALCGCALLASRSCTASGAARVGLAVALSFAAAEDGAPARRPPRDRDAQSPPGMAAGHQGSHHRMGVRAGAERRGEDVRERPAVRYDIDARGNRAPSTDFSEDASAPTLIVAGESIATGHSLPGATPSRRG